MSFYKRRERQITFTFQIGLHRLEDMERHCIFRVLEYFDGDRQEASVALGIERTTLFRRLKKYKQEDYLLKQNYITRKEKNNDPIKQEFCEDSYSPESKDEEEGLY